MINTFKMKVTPNNQIINFYKHQSIIYDLTRWMFLFKRKEILFNAKELFPEAKNILDVGCGTGESIKYLAELYPNSKIWGLDLSRSMLDIADKKTKQLANISLIQDYFPSNQLGKNKFDLIVFSYSLSMFNPGWKEAIEHAYIQLEDDGVILLLDFNKTNSTLLKRWMEINHVKIDGHLLPATELFFKPLLKETKTAYLGLWDYFLFIGKK